MSSLLVLRLTCVFLLTKSNAQPSNVTLQASSSTEAATVTNSTTLAAPELPPGGLPEVIVDPAEVTTSKVSVPVTVPASKEESKIVAKQLKEDGGLEIAVNPDAFPEKILGSKCKVPKDCLSINKTSCINGVCDCIQGFIPSKHSLDKCIKVPSGLQDDCEEEAQCVHVVAASECRGGKCSCPPNYVYDMEQCWEKQLLGGMCNSSMQCEEVALSLCAQGVCACQSPLIPSPNSNKCLRSAGKDYRASCVEDIQCTDSYGDEAHCSNSQCVCTNNYHFNGTSCVLDKKLGDPCETDLDCAVSDVNNIEGSRTCVSKICDCAAGFSYLQGENICMEKSSGDELAVSLTWIICIAIAKYYLS